MHAKKDSGFNGTAELSRCQVDGKHEYLVYANAAICQQELETMEANAP